MTTARDELTVAAAGLLRVKFNMQHWFRTMELQTLAGRGGDYTKSSQGDRGC